MTTKTKTCIAVILFLLLLMFCCCTVGLVSSSISTSNKKTSTSSSDISNLVTSSQISSQISSSSSSITKIINVLDYIDKPVVELSKILNITNISNKYLHYENAEADIYIESTDQKITNYVQVIFKQVLPCEPDITILDRVNGLIEKTDLQKVSDTKKISNVSAIKGSALYTSYMNKYSLRISASVDKQCLLTLYRQ